MHVICIYIYIYLLNLLVCFVLCYFFHLFERPLAYVLSVHISYC